MARDIPSLYVLPALAGRVNANTNTITKNALKNNVALLFMVRPSLNLGVDLQYG
jgi:hypothetical protein